MKKKLLQCLVLMFISLLASPTLSMAQQPLDKHVNITLKKVTVKQLLDELNRQIAELQAKRNKFFKNYE